MALGRITLASFPASSGYTFFIVPSIILFRRTSGKPPEENLLIARALGKPEVCEVLDAGGIIVVDPRRVRIRKLPIGSSDE